VQWTIPRNVVSACRRCIEGPAEAQIQLADRRISVPRSLASASRRRGPRLFAFLRSSDAVCRQVRCRASLRRSKNLRYRYRGDAGGEIFCHSAVDCGATARAALRSCGPNGANVGRTRLATCNSPNPAPHLQPLSPEYRGEGEHDSWTMRRASSISQVFSQAANSVRAGRQLHGASCDEASCRWMAHLRRWSAKRPTLRVGARADLLTWCGRRLRREEGEGFLEGLVDAPAEREGDPGPGEEEGEGFHGRGAGDWGLGLGLGAWGSGPEVGAWGSGVEIRGWSEPGVGMSAN
jgi:hypothetical protein